jgi:WD40 repeat protein
MAYTGWKAAPLILGVASLCTAGSGPESTDWSPPVNLGAAVNSPAVDAGPAISRDGRSLYFGSNRPGGAGFDLWVSTRRSVHDPWEPPANLGPTVNSSAMDNVPALSPDEHWLFFNSTRPGGFGDSDIWASWRPHRGDPLGWQAPVNLGPNINTPFFDAGPSLVEIEEDDVERGDESDDEDDDQGEDHRTTLLFYGRADASDPGDIYVSRQQPDGSFGPAQRIAEVSEAGSIEARPHVRRDGLEMLMQSDRPGSAALDLWIATRDTVRDSWGAPVNLGPTVNSLARDLQAYLTRNGKTLYFSSDRPGGQGQDLYVSTRSRRSGGEATAKIGQAKPGYRGRGRSFQVATP